MNRVIRTQHVLSAALLSVFLLTDALGEFNVSWSTIDCGGGTSTDGTLTISGSIGQADASDVPMSGGAFGLSGGYWVAAGRPDPCLSHNWDLDLDGDIDLFDFTLFQTCFRGQDLPSDCGGIPADCDGDGDVDIEDFLSFGAQLGGPG